MGSVKDLVVIKSPTPAEMGVGRFDFSNRYSVFDWGEMPDQIRSKGASLAMMSAYFFEQLQKRGVRTHYRGMEIGGRTYPAGDVTEPSTRMAIDLVRVIKPRPIVKDGQVIDYDYSELPLVNIVVPLEVIYRRTVPRGSSVFRRLREGSLTLQSMGLTAQPAEGDALPSTVIDVSTKYEKFDRYPDERKGENKLTFFRNLGGLSVPEIEAMQHALLEASEVITDGIGPAGLRNDDGKCEFALTPNRELMLVDAIGTLDECRFTYQVDGQPVEVSKEIPRQWYKTKQPKWVAEIDAAKKSGAEDWKSLVKSRPEPLPPQLAQMIGDVYGSVANAVLHRRFFDAPPLDVVVKEYQRFRELEMK